MLRYWFEKVWVQWTALACVVLAAVYYWGWVFDFGYKFEWSVLYTVNKTYQMNLGVEILKGLAVTIKISIISAGLALGLGTFFGLGRLSSFAPMRWVSSGYVEFFRNTPLLIQLFFWYFAMPMALPEDVRFWLFDHNYEFWSATIALAIYTGAFMAEVIRAGLQSIPKGLLEAAYSSGLTYLQVLRKIILPLAFRTIIPPLGSEFLNNMKNSSLAMVVGVAELCWQSQQVESLTFRGFEATTAATVLYIALSLIISGMMNTVNRNLRVEAATQKTWLRSFFGALARFVDRSFRLPTALNVRRIRKMQQQRLTYSPAMAAWHSFRAAAWKAIVLAAKASFLAFFVYLLYLIGLGLSTFNWQVIADNMRNLLIWRFPNGGPDDLFLGLGGLSFSILMAVIAISVSFFIGLIVGIGRTSKNKLFQIPAMLYIEIIRGAPLIMVIFWVYFFIPVVTNTFLDVFWSATIALTIFTGAYLAEIVRAGIQNIPAGQVEAAYSTGLNFFQTMTRVVLPQALKQMIPAIVGQFIAIFKDTSLAYVIGVLELTFVAQGLNNRLMIYPFEIYTSVATLYFVCCYAMSILAARLEKKLSPESVKLVM